MVVLLLLLRARRSVLCFFGVLVRHFLVGQGLILYLGVFLVGG